MMQTFKIIVFVTVFILINAEKLIRAESFKNTGNVLKRHQKSYNVKAYLGDAYTKSGLREKAIAAYLKRLAIEPNNTETMVNLAHLYLSKGLMDDAIESFANAVKINPMDCLIHFYLGSAYREKGLLDEAAKEFLEAKRICSKNMEYR